MNKILGGVLLLLICAGAVYKFGWHHEDTSTTHDCILHPDSKDCATKTGEIMTDTGVDIVIDHSVFVTGEVSFLAEMIPHHQEAIDMSSQLLRQTQNTGLKLKIVNIMTGQADEIKKMQQLLTDSYSGVEYKSMYMPMMTKTTDSNDTISLEKLYIENMILHHQGGLAMANKLLTILAKQEPLINATSGQIEPRIVVQKLAQTMVDTQTKEVTELQELLKNYESMTGEAITQL